MKKYLNLILSAIVIIALVCFWLVIKNHESKFAYVEIETVYNEFPMKKELEGKLTNVQQARKNILDSLKIQLNALSASVKSEKDIEGIRVFQTKKQEYLLKQKNFEDDNQTTTQNYSSQIWKQINQYVKDYGKEKNYTFILGTDGSGALMYGDEKVNITKELSDYVNLRYQGEKK